MMARYGRNNWTIEVPKNWELIDDPQCLTLDRPEGALQFSSAEKTNGSIDMVEILRVATQAGSENWGQSEEVRIGEFSGVLFDHLASHVRWRRWFLFQNSTLVLVTFNSDVESSEELWEEIVAVVGTLRLRPSKPRSMIHQALSIVRALVAGNR
jgi:hypothetical protein